MNMQEAKTPQLQLHWLEATDTENLLQQHPSKMACSIKQIQFWFI